MKVKKSIAQRIVLGLILSIPAKPLHILDIVSGHYNHFHWLEICDKLRRDLSMLTYIYLDVDKC